jgi:hypothetical protein
MGRWRPPSLVLGMNTFVATQPSGSNYVKRSAGQGRLASPPIPNKPTQSNSLSLVLALSQRGGYPQRLESATERGFVRLCERRRASSKSIRKP